MTKKDIIRTIAEEINLPQLQTRKIVLRTFAALIEALVQDGRVELRNFGIFQIKQRETRLARNPRTNEQVVVHARNVVTFKPGKHMEERVNEFRGATTDRDPPAPSESAGGPPSESTSSDEEQGAT